MIKPRRRRGDDEGPVSPPALSVYQAPGAPDWWKGEGGRSAQFEVANAVLPYLSPEDKATLRSQLALQDPAAYGSYLSAPLAPIPTRITSDIRNRFLGIGRAQQAATALQNMANLYGGASALGVGYDFLTKATNLLSKYGGSSGAMSRQSFLNFQAEANSLLSSARGNDALAPYASVASMFLNPTFSAGELNQMKRTSGGSIIFGAPSGQLYG